MKKHLWIILVALALVATAGIYWSMKKKSAPRNSAPVDYLSKLHIEDLRSGQGPAATINSRVRIHFVEWVMAGGKMIDSTYQRLSPLELSLTSHDVIQGLKDGIVGMKVGSKRKLIIPPHLAYGKQTVGSIPPNSHLVFEVELLDLLPDVATAAPPPTPLATPPSAKPSPSAAKKSKKTK